MGKSQPTYTKEFKQQAVKIFETSGKTKTQIARDLGISDSALNKWCKEFGEHGEEAMWLWGWLCATPSYPLGSLYSFSAKFVHPSGFSFLVCALMDGSYHFPFPWISPQ
jgi:hypothetical protein